MDDSGVQTARRLVLDPHPASAAAARRWISEQLRLLGHAELVDCAELATSELVTNAVLHARTPVTVILEPSEDRWRVAIADLSPAMATPVRQATGQVRSSGRGLHILSSISHRWGIEDEPPGKRIWFEPVADDARSSAPAATAPAPRDPRSRPDRRRVELRQAPVSLLRQARQRIADLHREMLLVSFAMLEDPPSGSHADVATRLVELAQAVEPIITELLRDQILPARLVATGADLAHLTCPFPPAGVDVSSWPDLLDEADDYCRSERLLTLAASRREAMARRWLLTEVARQSSGQPPVTWPDYVDTA